MPILKVRLPDDLNSRFEATTKDRGLTVSAAAREAIRAWVADQNQGDRLQALEDRLVATISRQARDARAARNDTQMAIAMLDTFVRVYLLHTPPVPRDAVQASAASADERHEKFVAAMIRSLQGDDGLLDRLSAAFVGASEET